LGVTTNAGGGWSITTQELQSLYDSNITETIDDSTGDNTTMTETATDTWATATFNGFAYSCGDLSGTTCVVEATSVYKQFACTGADAVCDVSSGGETIQNITTTSTAGTASSRVQYKLSVGTSQPAGDYTTTIVYVATPTF